MNSSRAFWLVFLALTGVAIHLAYILFIPQTSLRDSLATLRSETGTNALLIATPDNAAFSFAEYPSELAYAACAFDLSKGPVQITAQVPDQYWSIEIYGPRGRTVYTLNDQQAPRKQLNIVLHHEDPDPQTIVQAAQSSNARLNSITVLTGSDSGLAILRSAGANAIERARAMEALQASICAPAPS